MDEVYEEFCEKIEISDIDLSVVDEVAKSDANILRPIQGVCFETLFIETIKKYFPEADIQLGSGDSDVDIYLNEDRLQLKTIDTGSTSKSQKIGVALHKTHGNEKRPNVLYSFDNKVFDYLVVLHPSDGILIIPYEDIPESDKYPGYLDDPATFEWESSWLNRWDLLGFDEFEGKTLEDREIPKDSKLHFLSSKTYLSDKKIIETLTKDAYFRAAVMGLKGNVKEHWLISKMKNKGYNITTPDEAYPKYDFTVKNRDGTEFDIQAKGTSKNMCDKEKNRIGFEIMGTHNQFPERGYKKSHFDYVAIIISNGQLKQKYPIEDGFHFIYIPVEDLPLHYLIGEGREGKEEGWGNERWNEDEYSDVLYPNIKLKVEYNEDEEQIELYPNLSSYSSYRGFKTIPEESSFRESGPYILDKIPSEFEKGGDTNEKGDENKIEGQTNLKNW